MPSCLTGGMSRSAKSPLWGSSSRPSLAPGRRRRVEFTEGIPTDFPHAHLKMIEVGANFGSFFKEAKATENERHRMAARASLAPVCRLAVSARASVLSDLLLAASCCGPCEARVGAGCSIGSGLRQERPMRQITCRERLAFSTSSQRHRAWASAAHVGVVR